MPAKTRSDSTKAHDGPDERVVWRAVEHHERLCEFSIPHTVETWVSKRVTKVGMYPMNNGYEIRQMPYYADRQGRLYYARIDIDFHASTYYVTQPEKSRPWVHWQSRPWTPGRVAFDVLGRKL
jgi:hypothetical protein